MFDQYFCRSHDARVIGEVRLLLLWLLQAVVPRVQDKRAIMKDRAIVPNHNLTVANPRHYNCKSTFSALLQDTVFLQLLNFSLLHRAPIANHKLTGAPWLVPWASHPNCR